MARLFRTQLRNEARTGPNFAGHYTLARWGCGAGCVTVAVIDAVSGKVVFAPFQIEDAFGADGHITCNHSSGFKLNSSLFIATGTVNQRTGTHYFAWRDNRFDSVYFESCTF